MVVGHIEVQLDIRELLAAQLGIVPHPTMGAKEGSDAVDAPNHR